MSNGAATTGDTYSLARTSRFGLGSGRTRLVLQSEAAECGLACIAMIANYHEFDIDLVSLRERFPISTLGQDFDDLVDIAGHIGLASRALRAEVHELSDVELPCIIHWGINHFVVLSAIKDSRFLILDPAVGQRWVDSKEMDRHFSGVLIELVPSNNFKKAYLRRTLRLNDLWSKIRGLKISLAQILLLSLLFQICTVIGPLFMQTVVDVVLQKNQWALLGPLAVGFGLLIVTQAFISFLRAYAILHLSSRLSVQMASNLFHHLMRLPMSYFVKRHLGDIVSRFGSLNQVRQMMATGIVSTFLDGLMALITLLVLFFYSIKLTLIVLCIVAFYTMLRIIFFHHVKQLHQERIVSQANENTHFMETMRAVQTLKVFQKESDRHNHWLNKLTDVVNRDVTIGKWDASFAMANTILFGLESVVVIYIAVLLVKDSQFSLGMLFAFISFKTSFISAINNLITQLVNFKMLGVHFERISDIVFTRKETDTLAIEGKEPSVGATREIRGRIEAVNVGFRYEGCKQYIFRGLSFSINSGESVVITGPSGCGKTTLLKCLMGLLPVTEGEILIDGLPITALPGYRRIIAGVMQDDQLISGSIGDNISFFSSQTDKENLYRSAKMAAIHNDIMTMPMQYDTLVGDLGGSLSGGQKQRVILARALYRNPRILFMDEATSHLDVSSESFVNKQIGSLSITRVLVAHRPETVQSAGKQIQMA